MMPVWRKMSPLLRQKTSNALRQCRRMEWLQHGTGATPKWTSAGSSHRAMSDGRVSSSYDTVGSFGTSYGSGLQEGGNLSTSVSSLVNTDTRSSEEGKGSQSAKELLRVSAHTLRDAAEAELQAEVERDSRDGVLAIPPLPPNGWKVQHPTGSNFFVMTRKLHGGATSAELNTRRYQSVHNMFLQAMKKGINRDHGRVTRKRPTSGADDASHSDNSFKKMVIGYGADHGSPVMLEEKGNASDDCRGVERADIHLTLFAPFYVYDPSSHDSSIDICEWSSFDLLVQKTAVSGNINENPIDSLPHLVEDNGLCMFVRLASVNSEMRIRSVQLLSRRESQALTEHACFGRGEPMFLELLSCRQHTFATPRPLHSIRRYDDPSTHHDATPPPTTVSLTGTIPAFNPSLPSGERRSAYEVLIHCFDSAGEYGRTLCYGGPYMSELSKEMVEALQDYLQGDLGVSSTLCEYVCQMQFFLEQEEYMGWLGQLRHVAAVTSKNV